MNFEVSSLLAHVSKQASIVMTSVVETQHPGGIRYRAMKRKERRSHFVESVGAGLA